MKTNEAELNSGDLAWPNQLMHVAKKPKVNLLLIKIPSDSRVSQFTDELIVLQTSSNSSEIYHNHHMTLKTTFFLPFFSPYWKATHKPSTSHDLFFHPIPIRGGKSCLSYSSLAISTKSEARTRAANKTNNSNPITQRTSSSFERKYKNWTKAVLG